MVTILRLFAIDSMAFDNIKKQYEAVLPDIVEILPGIMPRIIKKITHLVPSPVIAGGMIVEKSDVIAAIDESGYLVYIEKEEHNNMFHVIQLY